MFIDYNKVRAVVKDSIVEAFKVKEDGSEADLTNQIRKLKDEVAELKTKKKMETVEIEHLVKMKEEKNALELEKERVEMMKEYQTKELDAQKELHDKTVAMLDEGKKDLMAVYKQILNRLPNVNMEIKKKN